MRLNIIFFSLFICCMVDAQNIVVDSCFVSNADSAWASSPRTDINGNPCSVIKVITRGINGNLEFKGNIIDKGYDSDKSIYTLYVTNKTKRLNIYHNDYIPEIVDFTIYEDSKYGLESNKVFYLYLSTKISSKPSNSLIPEGSRVLIFTSNDELKSISVDGNKWEIINGKSAKRLISHGIHKYEAVSIADLHIEGEIDLQPSLGSKKIELQFEHNE